jgi:RNA polymerase sigma-70 factor (ECF subfamily)
VSERDERAGSLEEEQLLAQLRPVAFAIAYRMLGSVSEAEDVVQEALLRVHQSLEGGEVIASPKAFVATVTTRLAINELRSARVRRERYVGDWLPEPIITDSRSGRGAGLGALAVAGAGGGADRVGPVGFDDPAQHAETADSLSLAMLVLLESLSPEQRAVLLLHDVFGYGYDEITDIVGKTEGNVRQLATRARARVKEGRPRFQTTREQHAELARRFFAAAEAGDLAGLESLLAHDVELTGDGGGKAPALARRLRGRSRVAHTLVNWLRLRQRVPEVTMRPVEVNGGPGALFVDGQERVLAVWSIDIAGGEVVGVRSIVNPDKLAHLGPVGDFKALLQSAE